MITKMKYVFSVLLMIWIPSAQIHAQINDDIPDFNIAVPSASIAIDATNFPDENFRNYLLRQDYGQDALLTEEEIAGITEIVVNPKGIADLTGIELLTNLTYLWCDNNQLTSLDVSKNTTLQTLRCSGNQLTSLDVSKNVALTRLDCSGNQLTSLDVSNNVALTVLDCRFNPLMSLDVSKNVALTWLDCSSNQLMSLDVSKNTALQKLYCNNNQLTSLDLTNNDKLRNLYCYYNQIKGTAMDELISSLPIGGNLYAMYPPEMGEGNEITPAQVTVAIARSWKVFQRDAEAEKWVEMAGEEPAEVIPEEAIDLGLPSGTKWAPWNVGASKPEDHGGYYAWGETEEKEVYDWSTYIHCDGTQNTCYDIGTDITGTDYDVAHVKWGGLWEMPTLEQVKELLAKCSSEWTTVNGIYGSKLTGPNGNSIFFPAAGFCNGGVIGRGTICSIWSGTLRTDDMSFLYSLHSFYQTMWTWSYSDRCFGSSVRPVISPFTLSDDEISLYVGDVAQVTINGGSGSFSVSAYNNNVTVSLSENTITIQANTSGETEVMVTDDNTGVKKAITISVKVNLCSDANHPHMIDLGLPSGTTWACCNVGAHAPESYGGHFAWGETEEKEIYTWSNYIHCDGSIDTCHDIIGRNIAGTEYDVAHVKWGGSWKMPTFNQINELLDNCTSEWMTVNGINVRRFTGPNGNSIFLPAAGGHGENRLPYNVGSSGLYWSSTSYNMPNDKYYLIGAYHLTSIPNSAHWNGTLPYIGLCVRPVIGDIFYALTLSDDEILLDVGDEAHVTIYGGSKSYSISASNDNVTVSLAENKITIQANASGEAEVTVTDDNTGEKKAITIIVRGHRCPDENHPHMIDLGLPSGTKWACCNVGAHAPEDYGGHFAWGETEEKESYEWETYTHNEDDLGSDIAGTDYDVAHVKCGGLWRMPTYEQWEELRTNCSAEWTNVNGIDGLKLTANNGNSIFLPAVGIRQYDNPSNRNSGNYWSSTKGNMPEHSLEFTFNATGNKAAYAVDHLGLSVRPVFVEDPDGIQSTDKGQLTVDDAVIYNLSGQRISKPQRGVNIINGKKMVVK